ELFRVHADEGQVPDLGHISLPCCREFGLSAIDIHRDLARFHSHDEHSHDEQLKALMLPEQKLDALIARHRAVEAELSTQLSTDTYVKLSREFAELGPIIETVKAYRGVTTEIDDLNTLIADPSTDAEMRTMASGEKPALEERRAALEQQI